MIKPPSTPPPRGRCQCVAANAFCKYGRQCRFYPASSAAANEDHKTSSKKYDPTTRSTTTAITTATPTIDTRPNMPHDRMLESTIPCSFYQIGMCRFGHRCRFAHHKPHPGLLSLEKNDKNNPTKCVTGDTFIDFNLNSWDAANAWMQHFRLPTATSAIANGSEIDPTTPKKEGAAEHGVMEVEQHCRSLQEQTTRQRLGITFLKQNIKCVDDVLTLSWTQIHYICNDLSLQDGINFKISLGLLDTNIVPGNYHKFKKLKVYRDEEASGIGDCFKRKNNKRINHNPNRREQHISTNYKSSLCENYHFGGEPGMVRSCQFGERCHYIHDELLLEINLKRFMNDLPPLAVHGNHQFQKVMVHNLHHRRPCQLGRDLSPNGMLLARGENKSVLIFDVHLWRVLGHFHGHTRRVTCVCFSADNLLIVSGSLDCTIRIWDLRSCTCTAVLTGFTQPVSHVVIDGSRIISQSNKENLEIVWDLSSGMLVTSCSIDGEKICSLSSEESAVNTHVDMEEIIKNRTKHRRHLIRKHRGKKKENVTTQEEEQEQQQTGGGSKNTDTATMNKEKVNQEKNDQEQPEKNEKKCRTKGKVDQKGVQEKVDQKVDQDKEKHEQERQTKEKKEKKEKKKIQRRIKKKAARKKKQSKNVCRNYSIGAKCEFGDICRFLHIDTGDRTSSESIDNTQSGN